MGSISKYVGEQSEDHRGQLFWPGAMGLPVRGRGAPTLTQSEHDEIEVQHDFHSEDFDLSDEKQKARYLGIMDRIVNGWYVLIYRSEPSRQADGRILVLVEWSQRYGAIGPATMQRAVGSSITKAG